MVVDVLRLVEPVPLPRLGSLEVSFVVHILDLEDIVEKVVELSLAPSSIEFGGWSISFQNHTICPYVVPYKVVGFALGDTETWNGPLRKPCILPAFVVV